MPYEKAGRAFVLRIKFAGFDCLPVLAICRVSGSAYRLAKIFVLRIGTVWCLALLNLLRIDFRGRFSYVWSMASIKRGRARW